MSIMKGEDIEKKSFEIISEILEEMGAKIEEPQGVVLKRVIHATADFDYVKNLIFSDNAVEKAIKIIRQGCTIVTDTNMAKSGISKITLQKSDSKLFCYIADPETVAMAKDAGSTRASVSMERAAMIKGNLIIAVGNAPTALIKLVELIKDKKIKPSLIIGVPVGFVNVVESKENVLALKDVPYIVARGRKGGSNVAAAIVNALLYLSFPRDMDKK